MTESQLKKKVMIRLPIVFGGWWHKTHGGPFQRGLPDIIGCVKGRFIAVELKAPGREGRVTKLQMHILNQIHNSGGLSFSSSSVDEIVTIIRRFLKESPHDTTSRNPGRTSSLVV